MVVPATRDRERCAIARKLQGFAPIADSRARLLILGSMPGAASLEAGQYYAHPRNAFWPILESIWPIPASAPYRTRERLVKRCGIAIWDVLASCQRRTSLDSHIEPHSIVVNDFAGFFGIHPALRCIAFNGSAAANLYRRHVLPELDSPARDLPQVQLPSTSPANARLSAARKLQAWSVLKSRT